MGKFIREKVKFRKFSTESGNVSKIGGKSETEGKCIMASGGWTPLPKIQKNYGNALASEAFLLDIDVAKVGTEAARRLFPNPNRKKHENESMFYSVSNNPTSIKN